MIKLFLPVEAELVIDYMDTCRQIARSNLPTSDVLPSQRVGNIRHIRVSLDEVSLDDAVEDARIVVVGPLRP